MKIFLKNISSQLKQYSKSLDKQSILIDKPWALIDDEFEMQRLIFKKDGGLILSKNGKVTEGSWEYLPTANSLLIDRGNDKILCNEEFVDDGVLILKLDGTDNRFFALANENMVPDLNVERYLSDMRNKKLNIAKDELITGKIIEFIHDPGYDRKVLIEGNTPKDGSYISKKSNKRAVVENGRLKYVTKLIQYTTEDGLTI